ncbi:hypothetical protein KC330_g4 [Hortaea werneckii]|nr:hypothetical protein KC330_g4 [Hortaea werneckii]
MSNVLHSPNTHDLLLIFNLISTQSQRTNTATAFRLLPLARLRCKPHTDAVRILDQTPLLRWVGEDLASGSGHKGVEDRLVLLHEVEEGEKSGFGSQFDWDDRIPDAGEDGGRKYGEVGRALFGGVVSGDQRVVAARDRANDHQGKPTGVNWSARRHRFRPRSKARREDDILSNFAQRTLRREEQRVGRLDQNSVEREHGGSGELRGQHPTLQKTHGGIGRKRVDQGTQQASPRMELRETSLILAPALLTTWYNAFSMAFFTPGSVVFEPVTSSATRGSTRGVMVIRVPNARAALERRTSLVGSASDLAKEVVEGEKNRGFEICGTLRDNTDEGASNLSNKWFETLWCGAVDKVGDRQRGLRSLFGRTVHKTLQEDR